MSARRAGLGRNLSALLTQAAPAVVTAAAGGDDAMMVRLPHDVLQPGQYQPRRAMDDVALTELAESIKQQGLLQPIIARELSAGRYEIVAGERRWRACQLAGLHDIPTIIRQVDDETAMAMALIENLQRESLNAIDQARAMHRLADEFGLTHQEIANLLSKSRAAVSNFLRLLHLNRHVQDLVEQGQLDMGHARCLLMLDESAQQEVADWVVSKQLSVRETEALVSQRNTQKLASVPVNTDSALFFNEQLRVLAERLNARVSVKLTKSGKGALLIHCNDVDNLRATIDKINRHVALV